MAWAREMTKRCGKRRHVAYVHGVLAARQGGPSVRSRTAQMGPREPGQEASAHGGLSGVRSGEDWATKVSIPPVEVSSSGSAPVAGLSSWVDFRVWERVYTRRERSGDSSGSEDSEAELMAQVFRFKKVRRRLIARCSSHGARHDESKVKISQGNKSRGEMASLLHVECERVCIDYR